MTWRAAIVIAVSLTAAVAGCVAVEDDAQTGRTVAGRDFGPLQTLEGVYFTNWENSAFYPCGGPEACSDWGSVESAWVSCWSDACRDLDDRIVALNCSTDNPGYFSMKFLGRRATAKQPKRFLNDREDGVLVEEILDFRFIRGVQIPVIPCGT